MKTIIEVITQSGSTYFFTQQDDGTFAFMRGLREGVLVKLKAPLEVGGTIDMDYLGRNAYDYAIDKDTSFLKSTKITGLKVMIC